MERQDGWNITRAKILRVVKDNEPISIKDLQFKTKIPRTTLYHHLTQLKKRKLLTEKTDKEAKGKYEVGHPVYITTNKANPLTEKTLDLMLKMEKLFK